jgi:dephospho-CoA kinase
MQDNDAKNNRAYWRDSMRKGVVRFIKTTVSRFLRSKRVTVVDADRISHALSEPGSTAYYEMIDTFGSGIIMNDGRINRAVLATLIFQDPSIRRLLNEIMHPWVAGRMALEILHEFIWFKPVVVLDIPLLFESNMQMICDYIICVSVPTEVQMSRLVTRDRLSEDAARQRIAAQLPTEEKAGRSDIVIHNTGTIESLWKQVDSMVKANFKVSLIKHIGLYLLFVWPAMLVYFYINVFMGIAYIRKVGVFSKEPRASRINFVVQMDALPPAE